MKQKLFFLAWQTNKLLKKQRLLKRKNVPFNKSKQIGVLYSAAGNDKQREVGRFVASLSKEGKQVKVLRYKAKDIVDAQEPQNTDSFGIEHLSFWGKMKNEGVAAFIQAPFDFLFCLDEELPHQLTRHVLVQSQAKCRVGGYYGDEASQFFELMISPGKAGLKSLTHDMLHYAKLI